MLLTSTSRKERRRVFREIEVNTRDDQRLWQQTDQVNGRLLGTCSKRIDAYDTRVTEELEKSEGGVGSETLESSLKTQLDLSTVTESVRFSRTTANGKGGV